jgi:hypothetical protein
MYPETVAATVQPFGQPSSGDQSIAPGGMTASNVCTLLAHVSSWTYGMLADVFVVEPVMRKVPDDVGPSLQQPSTLHQKINK